MSSKKKFTKLSGLDDTNNLSDLDMDIIPFDIETTGFMFNDEITAITLLHNGVYHSWVNNNGYDIDEHSLETHVLDESNIETVNVHVEDDEKGILEGLTGYVKNNIEKYNSILVAYNGETWGGGFDNGFIRGACIKYDIPFPFKNYTYTDVQPLIDKHSRINTNQPTISGVSKKSKLEEFSQEIGMPEGAMAGLRRDEMEDAVTTFAERIGEELGEDNFLLDELQRWAWDADEDVSEKQTGLVEVHRVLVGRNDGMNYDPYDDSREVIRNFEEGEFEELIRHNISDVHRTADLTLIFLKYVSQEDFDLKIL